MVYFLLLTWLMILLMIHFLLWRRKTSKQEITTQLTPEQSRTQKLPINMWKMCFWDQFSFNHKKRTSFTLHGHTLESLWGTFPKTSLDLRWPETKRNIKQYKRWPIQTTNPVQLCSSPSWWFFLSTFKFNATLLYLFKFTN